MRDRDRSQYGADAGSSRRSSDGLQDAVTNFERMNQRSAQAARERESASRLAQARKTGQKRRTRPIPPWVLVFFCFLYDTVLFHIWSQGLLREHAGFGRWFGILLFALAFALLFALIATISRNRKVHLVLGMIVTVFWSFMYLLEYFILDPFKNYMTIDDILSGAGNAAQEDFSARVMGLILKGFWRILLFALPIVLWFLINRYLKPRRILTRGVRRFLAGGGLIVLVVAVFFALVISSDTRALTDSYNFTAATNSFGLPVALIRQEINGGQPTGDPLGDIDGGSEPHAWDVVPTVKPSGSQETPTQDETGPVPTDAVPTGEDPSATVTPTEPKPPKPEKPYSVMALDFQALISSTSSERVSKLHKYVNSLTPSKTNEMTGLFKGKNLIVIAAEGFAKELIREDLTPTLYRMYTQGIQITDYYQPAWGGSTSTGEYSILTGLEPADAVKSIQETIGKNMYLTMGNQLRRLGYFSRAYHNNDYTYYNRDETHENLGYEKYIGMGNGMEEGVKKRWPESDQEMIDYTVPLYIDKQPFSIYYMTVSGHGLYSWGGNSMSSLHREEVQDLPYSDTLKAFFACNLEVEYAMRDLIQMLEEAGIADDTVIVLTADHYPYCLEKSDTWGNPESYLDDLYGYSVDDCFDQDHNALLIWSGCIEGKGIRVDTPVYSLDIVPTLSNLFGVDWDSRLLPGRDIFSDAEPLVLWPNCSWKTDLGEFNARTGKFTPVKGATIPDGYVKRIGDVVRQKIRYSDEVLDLDYFDILFG